MDWFYVIFGLAGLLVLLSAVYEWTWFWKLAKGGYLPDRIGWRNTRLHYLIGGAGCLGAAISLRLQSLFASESAWLFVPGFLIAGALTVALFNARKGQSFRAFLLNKEP